jgi:hypothetical protein
MRVRLAPRAAVPGFALSMLLLAAQPAGAFHVNGRHWDAMPIPYFVNPTGAPALADGASAAQVVADAAAAWERAPCADVAFVAMGSTTATWAADGQNTIFFVDRDWQFGQAAAGATLWIPTPEGVPDEVDLALNAADFRWVPGGGDATEADVVDPRALIAHELGHWLGLAHSPDAFATMYQALLPSGVQATLAGDDIAGICTLYPNGKPGCVNDADCGPDHACLEVAGLEVCEELHDPAGAPCDKDHLDCEGMCFLSFYECTTVCAFTAWDYTSGYCAPLCDGEGGCPDGWACADIPGQEEARVCLVAEPGPDAMPDAADEALGEDAGADAGEEAGPDADPAGEDVAIPRDAAEMIDPPGESWEPGDAPEAGGPEIGDGRAAAGGCVAGGGAGTPAGMAVLLLATCVVAIAARAGPGRARNRRQAAG